MTQVTGFNLSPNEIEDGISTAPGVTQIGVIGIPDEKSAEMPAAFVVQADDSVTEEAIQAACREKMTSSTRSPSGSPLSTRFPRLCPAR